MAARNRSTNDDASWFWGLRLHLITAPWGLPVAYALTGAEADERDTCLDMITHAVWVPETLSGLVRPLFGIR